LESVAGGQVGNCLQITRTGGNSQFAAQTITGQLIIGQAYTLSAYVKSGSSGNETYEINVYNEPGTGAAIASVTGTSSASWVKASVSFVATESGCQVALKKISATSGTMLFDEASLVWNPTAITAVYNYIQNAFYFYQFHKTPSRLIEARNSSGGLDVVLASRDGLLFTANSGIQDDTTSISASVRTRWFRMPVYENFRHAEIEFEAPTGQTLTAKAYLNFEATELRTISLAGATPTSTDQALRKPVLWKDTHFLRGEYFSLKFTNATAVGSAMKIASVKLFFAAMPRKDKIQGN
jgi:hypothetical protein